MSTRVPTATTIRPGPSRLIQVSDDAPEPPLTIPYAFGAPHRQRFAELDRERPTAKRKLYFSEVLSDPDRSEQPDELFHYRGRPDARRCSVPDNPPAIVTTQGSVEDWTIENRSMENHEFHIHQIHFLLLEQNGSSGEQRSISRHDPGTVLVGLRALSER